MYTARDIASIFVDKGIQEGAPITQMQLQKLVYFANGLLLAYSKGTERLVAEPFQAWDFGPVIPELYHQYKQFGAEPICPENDYEKIINGDDKGMNFKPYQIKNEVHNKIVDETWKMLKSLSGIQLSQWTHREGSAWSKVYKSGSRDIEVREEDIIAEFNPFMKKGNEVGAK